MLQFETTLRKFSDKGEKSGWTYIEITPEELEILAPGTRRSFRVKGSIDKHAFKGAALLPMGDGSFILPVNASMRKGIHKKEGALVKVCITKDTEEYRLNAGLLEALDESEPASAAFNKMPRSHQNYYSKWVDAAKTPATINKRLSAIVISLERGMTYAEMLRAQKDF
jgi:sugar phosphate isomerase/epimerase